MAANLTPIIVPLMSLAIATSVAEVAIPDAVTVKQINGSLRALTAGPFTVEIRVRDRNQLLASLSWSIAGPLRTRFIEFPLNADDELLFNITALGVGAIDPYIVLWVA